MQQCQTKAIEAFSWKPVQELEAVPGLWHFRSSLWLLVVRKYEGRRHGIWVEVGATVLTMICVLQQSIPEQRVLLVLPCKHSTKWGLGNNYYPMSWLPLSRISIYAGDNKQHI